MQRKWILKALIVITTQALNTYSSPEKPWGNIEKVCSQTANKIVSSKSRYSLEQIKEMEYVDYFQNIPISSYYGSYESFIYFNTTSAKFAKYIVHGGLVTSRNLLRKSLEKYRKEEDLPAVINIYKNWLNTAQPRQNLINANILKQGLRFNKETLNEGGIFEIFKETCAKIKLINCDNDAVRIARVASQKVENVPLSSEMTRFYYSQKYVPFLKFVTQDMLDKLLRSVNGKTVTGNILDDITHSLVKRSINPKDAKEFAWHFLGMYGTRGATFLTNGFLVSDYHRLALQILSLNISYLDKLKREQSGTSYFLPRQIKTNCPYGKPYHFWLAAYISKYSINQGFSKIQSFAVSAALGMAYDITADYNGRDPDIIFKKPLYADPINSKRMDNTMRTIGAYFGIHESKIKKSHNIDYIMESSFINAKKPSDKILSETNKIKKRIKGWISVVSPQSVLERLWLLKQ